MNRAQIALALVTLFCLVRCTAVIEPTEFATPFERSDSLETATYEEGIAWWRHLEESSPYVCLKKFGATDAGKPLHLVVINTDRNFSQEHITTSGKTVWLINNAIHPGEPDGVDASMLYARELLSNPDFSKKFEDVVILIIPFYNVGGALNRNCCSRANQNGPVSYGFRGNARNLDLNRDFTKADSKNAQSFIQLYQQWDPDVYLETHVSNGADYPYTLTYLTSHPGKLTPPLDIGMENLFERVLEDNMAALGDTITPYVNVFGTSPDSGFQRFYDPPRYSTGFTALHHAFGLLTETHMLKPFKQRVASTYRFLHCLGDLIVQHGSEIQSFREEAVKNSLLQERYAIDWKVDEDDHSVLLFKGYKAYYDTSTVTGLPQLYYDQSIRWEKDIPYQNQLVPLQRVAAPKAYLVPTAWQQVIDRLRWNGVEMKTIDSDTTLNCSVYTIDAMETSQQPYEGHYYHYETKVTANNQDIHLIAGSYVLVPMDQKTRRFLIEVLEPEAPDSYFNWNFFDEILQQKEWFSSYVFDAEAADMLKDPAIAAEFEHYKTANPNITSSAFAQLYFLYQRSDHSESSRHMTYPVFRIE